jgi:hypothetical protein
MYLYLEYQLENMCFCILNNSLYLHPKIICAIAYTRLNPQRCFLYKKNLSTDPPLCQQGKCVKTDQYGEEWECCNNKSCTRDCPLEANGSAVWRCGNSQYTTKWPDYDNCSSLWVANLTNMVG